jgi:hypothetical protein
LPTATMMVTGTPFLGGAFDGVLGLPYIMIFSLVIRLPDSDFCGVCPFDV